jgi:hypothetical protein
MKTKRAFAAGILLVLVGLAIAHTSVATQPGSAPPSPTPIFPTGSGGAGGGAPPNSAAAAPPPAQCLEGGQLVRPWGFLDVSYRLRNVVEGASGPKNSSQ